MKEEEKEEFELTEKIAMLKKYFPNVVSIDEKGNYLINDNLLKLQINPKSAELSNRYGLDWVGKKMAYDSAYTQHYNRLKPLKSESEDWENTGNVLIKGDNIDVLKILSTNYHEKIKMIYIDPPYNTKNENFIYKDNFAKSDIETLEELGYSSKSDLDYIENIYGARTHSGWLSFMLPRLLLAKDLLKDDGVIFISIDDNEVANLRLLCDEVFGEDNFVGDLIRKTKSTTNDSKNGINIQHENTLIYTKNEATFFGGEKDLSRYKNPDNDPNGDWTSADPSAKSGTMENNYFEVKNPYTGKIDLPPVGMFWRFSKNTIQKHIDSGVLSFKKEHKENERGFIYKRYKDRLKTTKKTLDSLVFANNDFMNQKATKELLDLGLAEYFTYPKSVEFIKTLLLHSTSTDKNDLILDFFAGSGTTADAVMQLNSEDNGNRKYILVQIPQPINPKKQKIAFDFVKNKLKKEPTIFEITAERIRRAGKKLKTDLTNQDLDIGFRVFETFEDEDAKIYSKPLNQSTQDDLKVFLNPPKMDIDLILSNLLISENFPLNSKIFTLIPNSLFRVGDVAFILKEFELKKIEPFVSDIEYLITYPLYVTDMIFTLEFPQFMANLGFKRHQLISASLEIR